VQLSSKCLCGLNDEDAPKIGITRVGAGVHNFWKAEKNLPQASSRR
jgi:hypothetical protein